MMSPGFSSPVGMAHAHAGVRFEEDSLPRASSASSPKVPIPSRPLSGLYSPAPPTESVPMRVIKWFEQLMWNRRVQSCVAASMSVSLYSIILSFILRFSIIHPYQFITDSLSSVISLSLWGLIVLVGVLSMGVNYFVLQRLASPLQRVRVSLRESSNWFSAFLFTLSHLLILQALIYITRSTFTNRFSVVFYYTSTFVCSLWTLFASDHQLNFAHNAPQLGPMHCILSLFSFSHESILRMSASIALHQMKYSYPLGVLMGLPLFGWDAIGCLVDAPLFVVLFCSLSAAAFSVRAAIKLNRYFVMKPVLFALPPPFAVHSPDEQQMRNLCTVLEVSHPLLRLFAFFDLRRIAWSDRVRRLEIFSLSQPGGHPRNWTAVCTACVSICEQIRTTLELAAAREIGVSPDEEEEPDREMLMLPAAMRKQLYSSAVRARHTRAAFRPTVRMASKANGFPATLYKKLFGWTEDEKLVVSRYDSSVAVLAIESLYVLCVESFEEDRYGVVQRDLGRVFSLLLATLQTVDKYFRARNLRADEVKDAPIRRVDHVLHTAIYRLNARFGDHIKALNLTSEERSLIQLLC